MFVCVGIIEEGFSLCAIQKILIDATFTSLYFIGENRKIYFDEDLGFFLECKDISYKNKYVCCSYDSLLCYEPLICCNVDKTLYFYFKSAPFNNLNWSYKKVLNVVKYIIYVTWNQINSTKQSVYLILTIQWLYTRVATKKLIFYACQEWLWTQNSGANQKWDLHFHHCMVLNKVIVISHRFRVKCPNCQNFSVNINGKIWKMVIRVNSILKIVNYLQNFFLLTKFINKFTKIRICTLQVWLLEVLQ